MQKSIVLLLLLALIYAGCHRGNKIEISGKIENGGGSSLILEEMNVSSNNVVDSLKLGNSGKFKFKNKA